MSADGMSTGGNMAGLGVPEVVALRERVALLSRRNGELDADARDAIDHAKQYANRLEDAQRRLDAVRKAWDQARGERDAAREELSRRTVSMGDREEGLVAERDALRDQRDKAEAIASDRGGDLDRLEALPGPLLEAEGGLFVPIPAGHMLSVTVTPYDATLEPAEHVCSTRCGDGSSEACHALGGSDRWRGLTLREGDDEPPVGTIVLDNEDDAWQRQSDGWVPAVEGGTPELWAAMHAGNGPVRVIYAP